MYTLLLVFIVGATLFVYGASTEVSRAAQADTRDRSVLEQAREALIARAVADGNHPGSLPCPDALTTNPIFNNFPNDGIADEMLGTDCPSYIGRLPWRTLGVGDLRDEAGERLWYALSPNFHDYPTVTINSDSKGDRIVHGGSTSTTLTAQAAAVVFAAGTALPGQVRDSVTAACSMSGVSRTMRRDLCAANYLETAASATPTWNNASATGPYMNARPTLAFNDKLLVIRAADFMPLVERRVARELREVLRNYRARSESAAAVAGGCNCLPWPDANSNGTSDTTSNRGRIPLVALPHPWGWSWTNPVTKKPFVNPQTGEVLAPLPALPSYFVSNNWASVIYYTVAKSSLHNNGVACTTCSGNATLSVDGANGYGMVLMTTGVIMPAQTRSAWAHYIDDAENRDANPQAAEAGASADPAPNDAYLTPPPPCPTGQCPTLLKGVQRCIASNATCPRNVTAPGRDRIYVITAASPNAQCAPNASVLLNSAPCHTTGNNVKAVCRQAADNLDNCSCAEAADAMITPPCRNTLNPPQCQAAVKTLQSCRS